MNPMRSNKAKQAGRGLFPLLCLHKAPVGACPQHRRAVKLSERVQRRVTKVAQVQQQPPRHNTTHTPPLRQTSSQLSAPAHCARTPSMRRTQRCSHSNRTRGLAFLPPPSPGARLAAPGRRAPSDGQLKGAVNGERQRRYKPPRPAAPLVLLAANRSVRRQMNDCRAAQSEVEKVMAV